MEVHGGGWDGVGWGGKDGMDGWVRGELNKIMLNMWERVFQVCENEVARSKKLSPMYLIAWKEMTIRGGKFVTGHS